MENELEKDTKDMGGFVCRCHLGSIVASTKAMAEQLKQSKEKRKILETKINQAVGNFGKVEVTF